MCSNPIYSTVFVNLCCPYLSCPFCTWGTQFLNNWAQNDLLIERKHKWVDNNVCTKYTSHALWSRKPATFWLRKSWGKKHLNGWDQSWIWVHIFISLNCWTVPPYYRKRYLEPIYTNNINFFNKKLTLNPCIHGEIWQPNAYTLMGLIYQVRYISYGPRRIESKGWNSYGLK